MSGLLPLHAETMSNTPLVRFKEACEDYLGMSIDAGYAAEEAGTFPVEILRIGKIRKCRKVDLQRVVFGDQIARGEALAREVLAQDASA